MRFPIPRAISRLARRIGLDAGVSFAALTRGWGVLGAVITIGLVVRSFSPVLQGYYYGFLGLLVLQQLFQTGLSVVMQQYASHEWARLRVAAGAVVGESSSLSRLASLIRLSRRAFAATSGIAFVVLVLAGHLMFGGRQDPGIGWIGPWYALCLATSLSMLVLPRSAILEGTGHVAAQQRAQLISGVVGSVGGWFAILAGLELYSVALIVGLRTLVLATLLAGPYRPFAGLRVDSLDGPVIRWSELWPLQWRVTVTWLTGILLYQSMVPLTFLLIGPVAAGQMGLLNQVLQAVIGIGGVWLVSAQPLMGRLAAAGQFDEVRRLTRATAIRCSVTAAFVGASALIFVALIATLLPDVGARFGSPWLLAILLVAAVAIQPAAAMVAAIRFQKKEPFVRMGLVTSALSIVGMSAGAIWYGLAGVVIAFTASVVLSIVPWATSIYRREMAHEDSKATKASRNVGDPTALIDPELPPVAGR